MSQIGAAAMDGMPLWYYGVENPEDIQAYLVRENPLGETQVIKFETLKEANMAAKSPLSINPKVVPCPI